MIQIRDLTIGYSSKKRQHIVADHLNATLQEGELTCLLGANGAGKSTLLRTLSAFQPQLAGEILMEGRDLGSYSDKERAQLVSVVLTERLEVYGLSVSELIALGRSPYTGFWGGLEANDREVVQWAMDQTGITHLSHRKVHTLSDGERQKVMIAKALAQETPVIYLDEPTAFLDYPSKVEMMQLLHHLSRSTGRTIFLSTHDLELALQTADKIWLLRRKRVESPQTKNPLAEHISAKDHVEHIKDNHRAEPTTGITTTARAMDTEKLYEGAERDKENALITGTPEDLLLDGTLARFFQSPSLSFDYSSGTFRVIQPCRAQVIVCGDGLPYRLLCRALQRIGFAPISVPTGSENHPIPSLPRLSVISSGSGHILYHLTLPGNSKQMQFSTIQEVLDQLSQS